jgi:hypothetical protein
LFKKRGGLFLNFHTEFRATFLYAVFERLLFKSLFFNPKVDELIYSLEHYQRGSLLLSGV